jgi:uncharacterized membrane protein
MYRKKTELATYLQRKFVTGVLILTPVVVTGWLFWKIFSWVDNMLAPLQERYIILDWPGVGFVVMLLLVLLTGIIGGNLIGRRMISAGERVVFSIPLIRRVYTAVKELGEVFLSDKNTVFKEVVLVRFPHRDALALGFVARESPDHLKLTPEDNLLNVFVPTTPNPTSGFLLLIPSSDVIRVPITVEEGLKMVISGGAYSAANEAKPPVSPP